MPYVSCYLVYVHGKIHCICIEYLKNLKTSLQLFSFDSLLLHGNSGELVRGDCGGMGACKAQVAGFSPPWKEVDRCIGVQQTVPSLCSYVAKCLFSHPYFITNEYLLYPFFLELFCCTSYKLCSCWNASP